VDTFFVKLWQAVVSGLSIGSVYALIAQGYYVTFITTGALNFGQGEFLMMGALFGLTCYVTLGLPYGLAVAGAVVLVGLMGVGLERVAIRPVLRHALSLSWVLSTVAISIILTNAAHWRGPVWASMGRRTLHLLYLFFPHEPGRT